MLKVQKVDKISNENVLDCGLKKKENIVEKSEEKGLGYRAHVKT